MLTNFGQENRVLHMLRSLLALITRMLQAIINFGTSKLRYTVWSTLIKGNTKLLCQH